MDALPYLSDENTLQLGLCYNCSHRAEVTFQSEPQIIGNNRIIFGGTPYHPQDCVYLEPLGSRHAQTFLLGQILSITGGTEVKVKVHLLDRCSETDEVSALLLIMSIYLLTCLREHSPTLTKRKPSLQPRFKGSSILPLHQYIQFSGHKNIKITSTFKISISIFLGVRPALKNIRLSYHH